MLAKPGPGEPDGRTRLPFLRHVLICEHAGTSR